MMKKIYDTPEISIVKYEMVEEITTIDSGNYNKGLIDDPDSEDFSELFK